MITPELVAYVRGEFSKGKTREEIKAALMRGGGWSEDDLSEAFREVIPMQAAVPSIQKPTAPAQAPVVSPLPTLSPSPSFSPPKASVPPVVPPPAFSPAPAFSPPSFTPTPAPAFSPQPMRTFTPPPSLSSMTAMQRPAPLSNPVPAPGHSRSWIKYLVILILLVGFGFGAWFYQASVLGLWDSLMNPEMAAIETTTPTPVPDFAPEVIPTPILEPTPLPVALKDCGTMGVALKLGTSATYEKDSALVCLGASALVCENAKVIIKDELFPTIFEITKSANTESGCSFRLSYGLESTLTDLTGKNLAGQYVSCPLSVVKSIDNTKPATPKFNTPNMTSGSKYAADIFFYGTLGLFMENNLDPTKIQTLGCNGEYINSMIASYNAKK